MLSPLSCRPKSVLAETLDEKEAVFLLVSQIFSSHGNDSTGDGRFKDE